MIDLERRSTNALSFLITLVSARRKRVRDIDLRGKGSPLLHSCRVSRGKMPPVIIALAGICIGKLRINDARARDWPHSHSLSKPRHSAILLFLLSECFNESLSPLFFATTRASLRGIYHRVYKWENGEEMRLYTAFPEIFWFLEDKKRGFV